MKAALNKLEAKYRNTLEQCIEGVGEAALEYAYEVGHQAVQDGLGVMNVLSVHMDLQLDLLSRASSKEECVKVIKMTHAILTECLVPFEFTHRGFKEVESAKRDLESFSYSVSHDLRAPLRAIDGFSKILLRNIGEKLTEEEQHNFNIIRDNAQKMEKMIEGLLALSRFGRSAIRSSDFDMSLLIDETWEELRVLNPGRNMVLQSDTLPPAWGDRVLIREVLTNLLANAVKFTRLADRAVITVGGNREDRENVYRVQDNGIGFDMAFYDKLFNVFQRIHSSDEFEGTGVGLALVSRIIRRHGGRVWATGAPRNGATFYFTLPIKEEELA